MFRVRESEILPTLSIIRNYLLQLEDGEYWYTIFQDAAEALNYVQKYKSSTINSKSPFSARLKINGDFVNTCVCCIFMTMCLKGKRSCSAVNGFRENQYNIISMLGIRHLCAILEIKPKTLMYLANSMSKNVSCYKMKKKVGDRIKIRNIYAPSEVLKSVQRKIDQRVLTEFEVHECAHGFVSGRGILTNAKCHYGRNTIINIDLKDFFPSIRTGRIFNFWRKRVRNPTVSYVLTKITSYDDHLCQGFVTSPGLANRMAIGLDRDVQMLADGMRLNFTRYADDITLSTDRDVPAGYIIREVTDLVRQHGFTVNRNKIHVMRPHRRQAVTGLVVNETAGMVYPRIPREDKRRIRAMCHKGGRLRSEEDADELGGWLSYIKSVEPKRYEQFINIQNKARGYDDGRYQECAQGTDESGHPGSD